MWHLGQVRLLATIAVVLCGCTRPNPVFDEGSEGQTTTIGTPTTGTPTTAGPVTTQPETASSTQDATTVDPTLATTVDPTTMVPTSDTDSESDTESESESESQPSGECWDADPTQWVITEIVDADLGIKPADPWITPDGFGLYYSAGSNLPEDPPQNRRIYFATRDSREELFITGDIVAEWPNFEFRTGSPSSVIEGELFVALDYDIYWSVKDEGVWKKPEVMPLSIPYEDANLPPYDPINIPTRETLSRISEKGEVLMFSRQDGHINPETGVRVERFYEASRSPNSPAGTPFSEPFLSALPSFLADPYPHPILCPALSPDGRTLFFSSPYPEEVPQDPNERLDVL
ncbi:MAG: hypothetical protein ACPG77_10525, partial [Nannocystaceae bacterium]